MRPDRPAPLALEIARIGLAVAAPDAAIRLVAQATHVPFLVPEAGEDCARVLLKAFSGRAPRRRPGRTLFETGAVWRLEEVGDNHLLTFRSPLFGADPYLSVEFDRDYRDGRGETLVGGPLLAGDELHPFVYPFDEVIFLARLARGRGVLVHACGLAIDGRGILFLGTSGAGKSTTARLWEQRGGTVVLSDDRIVIRPEGGGFRIYGTPWHGEAGLEAPVSAPLEAVFILEQAARNRIEEISPTAAVAQMMVRAFPAMWDQSGLEFAVAFLADLAARVPVRRLQFLPEPSAVDCVLQALRAGQHDPASPPAAGEPAPTKETAP